MDKLIKKWKVILDMLPIDKEYYGVISDYCEKYSDIKANSSSINSFTSALKVLSKINLSKVIFTNDKSICQATQIIIKINPDDIYDIIRQIGTGVIDMYISMIIEELVKYLNKIIDKDGGIVINELFSTYDFSKISNNNNNIIVESYTLPLNVYRYMKLNKIINKIK